ncbi:hypothetical protein AB205_0133020 [Aquarana catesbeiana]|uniref:Uncharacterized protein n=1 Tax=Aquarana catesbeiana TaxID=8400 RepID=A0A2G9RYA8_AQUCT|nr:hypothetical protein AB205_0133020 [Aquarana catesbeiana]
MWAAAFGEIETVRYLLEMVGFLFVAIEEWPYILNVDLNNLNEFNLYPNDAHFSIYIF